MLEKAQYRVLWLSDDKTYQMYIGDMTGHRVIEWKLCAAEFAWKSFFYCHDRLKSYNHRRKIVRYLQNTFASDEGVIYLHASLRYSASTTVFANRALVTPSLRNFWSDWKCVSRRNWVIVQNVLEVHFLLRPGQNHGNELKSVLRGAETRLACSRCATNVLNEDEIVYF